MTTAIKRRRGTTTQHSTFTGLEGEITVDSTKDTVVVHDGATAGGIPLLREDLSNNTAVVKNNVSNTFSTSQIISANTSTDALRITQVGAGNALVVEDSANPDATPFVVDANGKVLIGNKTPIAALSGRTALLQYNNVEATAPATILASFYSGTNYGSEIQFVASKSGTAGTFGGAVANGQGLGSLQFYGDDGTAGIPAAQIYATVDGTPGTNDMPGRLVFSTTADGASSPTERMRIDNGGFVGIGATSTSYRTLRLGKNPTGNTFYNSQIIDGTIQSDVTSQYRGISAYTNTQAAAFTLGNSYLYVASQGTIGAGSAVTNQIGFFAESNLTGATNNYGFYSGIAAGTGRYNFYAAGSADNYFAGSVGIGESTIPRTQTALRINGAILTATDLYPVDQQTTVPATATTGFTAYRSVVNTAAAAFTLPTIQHFAAIQTTLGAGSTVTNQYGYVAGGSLTGATNNYGFSSNIASGTGRYNFYAAGSADNYFAGKLGVGVSPANQLDVQSSSQCIVNATSTSSYASFMRSAPTGQNTYDFYRVNNSEVWRITVNPTTYSISYGATPTEAVRIDSAGRVGIGQASAGANLNVQKNATGSANLANIYSVPAFQSDVTGSAVGFWNNPFTAAASFTVNNLQGFRADGVTLGSGSAVTSQEGFTANTSLTAATNNYGFRANIASGTGRYNFYAAGSADNYFAGKVITGSDSIQVNTAKTPASATATGTTGQIAWDANYVYVCVATNTWKRTAIATW